MSLDLSWSLLDEAFVAGLLGKLNDVLSNASRPEYIGPIALTNLVLGTEAPDVSIVNVGDVWESFLQRDHASMAAAAAATLANGNGEQHATSRRSLESMGPPGAREVRRDGHLARFANKNLPFSAVRSDSPGPGGQYASDDMDDDLTMYNQDMLSPPPHEEVPVRRRGGAQRDGRRPPRIETYRQYSDSGHFHRVDAASMSDFDGYSSIAPSGVTTPNPWGAGLQHAGANGGYFSAWQGGGYASSAAGVPLPPSVRSAPHSRRTSWHRQGSVSVATRSRLPSPRNAMISPPLYAGAPPASTYAGFSSRGGPPLVETAHGQHDELVGGGTSTLPSLQLQLSLHWTTQSLRLTLDTSLVINHPSPAFMSLPLTITITGLSLGAGGVLAFEVDPVTSERRSHFCLLVEEEDELVDDAEDNAAEKASVAPNRAPRTALRPPGGGQAIQPTPGERVLYNLNLETSVGQADKHVLRNVTKVERFVVSLIRKAITDELIYPNFYSIELP